MTKTLVCFIFLATLIVGVLTLKRHTRQIIGGETIEITQVPYHVQILYDETYVCGGALITSSCVLTAAHCIYKPTKLMYVLAGSDRRNIGTRNELKQIYIPGKFSYTDEDSNEIMLNENLSNIIVPSYDIAVIKLIRPYKLSKDIKIIPITNKPFTIGEEVKLTGFGAYDATRRLLRRLHVVKSTIINCLDSDPTTHSYYTPNILCVNTTAYSAAYFGDSGGPLVDSDGKLVGILSEGFPFEENPDMYVDVYFFRNFIEKHMKL